MAILYLNEDGWKNEGVRWKEVQTVCSWEF